MPERPRSCRATPRAADEREHARISREHAAADELVDRAAMVRELSMARRLDEQCALFVLEHDASAARVLDRHVDEDPIAARSELIAAKDPELRMYIEELAHERALVAPHLEAKRELARI